MRRLLLLLILLSACGRPAPQVVSDGPATLTIPPGAADGVEVQISEDANPPVAPPDNRIQLGPIFALTPHGHAFDAPIGVSIPYTHDVSHPPEVLRLGDDIDDIWTGVANVGFNDGLATWSTTRFSWYGVFGPVGSQVPPGDDDDAADDDDATSDDDDSVDDDDSAGPTLFDGDYDITSTAEMEAFCAEHYGTTGDFSISGPGFPDTDALACLGSIGGTLSIEGTQANDVTLPNLQTISGRVFVSLNEPLLSLRFPALEEVGDDVLIGNSPDLALLDLSSVRVLGGVTQMQLLGGVQGLSLSQLEEVGGALTLSGMSLVTSLTFDSLVTSEGEVAILDCTGLTEVTFPVLETAGGVTVRNAPLVPSLDLPVLTAVEDALSVTDCAAMESLTAPSLTEVGDLDIDNAWGLTTLSLPLLATSDGLVGISGTDLTTVSLPSLVAAVGALALSGNDEATALDMPAVNLVGGLGFVGNDRITSLSLPSLANVNGQFQINGNDALTGFDLPALTLVDGDFEVENNEALGDATAQALADAITITGDVVIDGN